MPSGCFLMKSVRHGEELRILPVSGLETLKFMLLLLGAQVSPSALPSRFLGYVDALLYFCLSGAVRSVAVCAGPASSL